jgi:hypothetical protein
MTASTDSSRKIKCAFSENDVVIKSCYMVASGVYDMISPIDITHNITAWAGSKSMLATDNANTVFIKHFLFLCM